MDKIEVKIDVNKRLTNRHIDALNEAMDKLMNERMDVLENGNEKRQK